MTERKAPGRVLFSFWRHLLATSIAFLAFVFVIHVRHIPFSAIESISTANGALALHLDKSKLEINPILKLFVSKDYVISGFAKEKKEVIKAELEKYI